MVIGAASGAGAASGVVADFGEGIEGVGVVAGVGVVTGASVAEAGVGVAVVVAAAVVGAGEVVVATCREHRRGRRKSCTVFVFLRRHVRGRVPLLYCFARLAVEAEVGVVVAVAAAAVGAGEVVVATCREQRRGWYKSCTVFVFLRRHVRGRVPLLYCFARLCSVGLSGVLALTPAHCQCQLPLTSLGCAPPWGGLHYFTRGDMAALLVYMGRCGRGGRSTVQVIREGWGRGRSLGGRAGQGLTGPCSRTPRWPRWPRTGRRPRGGTPSCTACTR
jgi:hypothetical protein